MAESAIDPHERVLKLLAYLLDSPQGADRNEILRDVPGYSSDPEVARRMFMRDQKVLQALGVTLHKDDENPPHYRVDPDEYYLPDLGLEPDEAFALDVARTAVQVGDADAELAMLKLDAPGAGPVSPLAALDRAPALAPLFEAWRTGASVTFAHRGRARRVDPYGLVSRRGHWYLVGHDHDRDALRNFRVDRITDVSAGEPGTVTVPEGFDADDHVDDRPWRFGSGPAVAALVRVDPGFTAEARERVGFDAPFVAEPDGGIVLTVEVRDPEAFVGWVLGFADHAELLEPPELRAAIVERLRAMAGEV